MDEHPGSQRIPLTLNKYLYGNADPVNTIDPSGNFLMGQAMSTNLLNMASVQSAFAMTSGGVSLTKAVATTVQISVAIMTISTVAVTVATKEAIEECMAKARQGKKCNSRTSVFILGDDVSEVRGHVSDALEMGYPRSVTRASSSHPRGWLEPKKQKGQICDSKGRPNDCDEYPMAAMTQGGEMNAPSLRSLNSSQNRSAGAQLRWFHSKCKIQPSTDNYRVVAMSGVSTGYICGR